jgi:hypothetical protein
MLLYFVPSQTAVSPPLNTIGLAHIVDQPGDLMTRQVTTGPMGVPGVVIASKHSISESELGYFVDRQEWKTFGKFAIGKQKDAPIKPESLRRPSAIDGHIWTDWAGNKWEIPIARRWVDGSNGPIANCNLPRSLGLDENGKWVYDEVLPHLKKLWSMATDFFESCVNSEPIGDNQVSIKLPELDDICSVVFGANYRVTKFEMSFLQVLTQESLVAVLDLLIDMPGLNQLQKKTV